ncbi:MAG: hypothetical protein LBE16_09270, partial [Clostridiales Family XIII bacterium]|nr:hypothetical protein [Clostridiales Family XIII bacterium]
MSGKDIYKQLLAILREGERAAVVSRFEAGSITKRLAREGEAEWDARAAAEGPLSFVRDEGARTLTEYYAPKPRLLILGGGHIALALSAMGALIDFD